MKISVIIPVYNAGNFIKPTLDSLKNQTMDKSDFEILAVDDLSTDNSLEILESYRTDLPNLRIIKRETNSGGPMVPRNDAIEMAKGEYVQFLDNDDYLGEDALKRLYAFATENNSDVIFGKYKGINGRGVPKSQFLKGNIAHADIIKDNLIYTIAPHKMFRRKMLIDQDIRFETEIRPGDEDKLFVMRAYLDAKVISILSDYDYYYVVRRPGENLSVASIPQNPELHFIAQKKVLHYIEKSRFDQAKQLDLKVAYVNRLISFSILRASILNEKYEYQLRKKYFSAARDFFLHYVGESVISKLKKEHAIFVQKICEDKMDELIEFEKVSKKLNQSSDYEIDNGQIYYQMQYANGYKERLNVSFLNKTSIYLNSVTAFKKKLYIGASLHHTLIANDQYLICKERTDGQEITIKAAEINAVGEAVFILPIKKLENGLIWDLFIESHKPIHHRRRLGKDRNLKKINMRIDTNKYQFTAYTTKDFDNLSIKKEKVN
ncbi:glycosyltransferase family 2 protein [Enterococcus casseliflavus]|nr:glycosyltransferase family 2 protein [Enterococcus casseliflavus]